MLHSWSALYSSPVSFSLLLLILQRTGLKKAKSTNSPWMPPKLESKQNGGEEWPGPQLGCHWGRLLSIPWCGQVWLSFSLGPQWPHSPHPGQCSNPPWPPRTSLGELLTRCPSSSVMPPPASTATASAPFPANSPTLPPTGPSPPPSVTAVALILSSADTPRLPPHHSCISLFTQSQAQVTTAHPPLQAYGPKRLRLLLHISLLLWVSQVKAREEPSTPFGTLFPAFGWQPHSDDSTHRLDFRSNLSFSLPRVQVLTSTCLSFLTHLLSFQPSWTAILSIISTSTRIIFLPHSS